jgi:hypothetical protein
MLRAPINLLWAPVYALVCLVKILVPKRTGLMWLESLANRVPADLTTRVQQHISHLILVDMLNNGQEGSLLEGYLIKALEAVYERHTCKPIDHQRFNKLIEPLVADALSQYRITRTASVDITNSILCTVLGAFAFQKFTQAALGSGWCSHPCSQRPWPPRTLSLVKPSAVGTTAGFHRSLRWVILIVAEHAAMWFRKLVTFWGRFKISPFARTIEGQLTFRRTPTRCH